MFRIETDAQCLEEFAAAVYFNIDAGIQHDFQDRHIRVCLRRVAKLDRAIHRLRRTLEATDVVVNSTFRKNKQGRVEFLYKLEGIDAVDGQVIVAHFQITRDGPCRTQRGYSR